MCATLIERRSPERADPRRRGVWRPRLRRSRAADGQPVPPDAPIITFSSLSKAYLAPGWRAGWLSVGRTKSRNDDVLVAVKKLADGRLCSTGADAISNRRRADRGPFARAAAARAALRERAEISETQRLNAIDGISVVAPAAAFYAMPRVSLPQGVTDEDYVLGLLRDTGVLCVYPIRIGTDPHEGFFRVVFLASPSELSEILRGCRGLHSRLPGARRLT